MKKGCAYREKRAVNWKEMIKEIDNGLNNLIQIWSEKDTRHSDTFQEWKTTIMKILNSKIQSYIATNREKNCQPHQPILKNKDVQNDLKELHKNYVLVNTDKCDKNVTIICKRFYVSTLRNELRGTTEITRKKENKKEETNSGKKDTEEEKGMSRRRGRGGKG